MTGGQFLRFLAQYRGMRSFARAKELAEYFELDAGAKLKKMSKGTKQKVAIVCAFMHDPQLYVLDEPTGGRPADAEPLCRAAAGRTEKRARPFCFLHIYLRKWKDMHAHGHYPRRAYRSCKRYAGAFSLKAQIFYSKV